MEVDSQYVQGSCLQVILPDVLPRSATVMSPDQVADIPDRPLVTHPQPVILLALVSRSADYGVKDLAAQIQVLLSRDRATSPALSKIS